MTWNIEFLEEAEKDLKKLDHSAQIQVLNMFIKKQQKEEINMNCIRMWK